jgi:hypothetical protein
MCQGFSIRKPMLVASDCSQNVSSLVSTFISNVAMLPGIAFTVACPAGTAS